MMPEIPQSENLVTLGKALIKCDVESIETDGVEKQRRKEHSWGDVKILKKNKLIINYIHCGILLKAVSLNLLIKALEGGTQPGHPGRQ